MFEGYTHFYYSIFQGIGQLKRGHSPLPPALKLDEFENLYVWSDFHENWYQAAASPLKKVIDGAVERASIPGPWNNLLKQQQYESKFK